MIDYIEETTEVTISQTTIEFYDPEFDKSQTVDLVGKLTVLQAKDYCKNVGVIYINKTNHKETFKVPTIELYKLKIN